MIHTIRIPYRRASSRLGSWLLWITGRLRTFLDFSLGSKFCFCCKAFPFVQGHAVGIIENVGREGVASFPFRHSGSKIAPQTHVRLPPSAPSFRCSFRPPLLMAGGSDCDCNAASESSEAQDCHSIQRTTLETGARATRSGESTSYVYTKFREKYGAKDVKQYYSTFDAAVVTEMG